MVKISSVSGMIDTEELGMTLIHEHLRIRSESLFLQFPHLYDEEKDFKLVVDQVNEAMSKGVKTICDPTVMELGRDINFMKRVADETGLIVIPSTGVYSYHYLVPYLQNRDADHLAELFIRDIEVGIQGTDIKAAFIKCSSDSIGITPDLEKLLRASARAHLATGVPIMTHSHPASGSGLLQLDIFEDEGVNLQNVQIGHCGDTDDLDYLVKILERGATIGMDRYGLPQLFVPNGPDTSGRNNTVIELINKGYINQLYLSQDHACAFDWVTSEVYNESPKSPLTFLMDDVIPSLIESGITHEQIDTLFIENPKNWFVKK